MKHSKKLQDLLKEANKIHDACDGFVNHDETRQAISLCYNVQALKLFQMGYSAACRMSEDPNKADYHRKKSINIGNMGIAYQQAYRIIRSTDSR